MNWNAVLTQIREGFEDFLDEGAPNRLDLRFENKLLLLKLVGTSGAWRFLQEEDKADDENGEEEDSELV